MTEGKEGQSVALPVPLLLVAGRVRDALLRRHGGVMNEGVRAAHADVMRALGRLHSWEQANEEGSEQ